MYANDRLNDCTTAAVGHKIMAATGWAGHLHTPSEASVVNLYWSTGKQDDGRFPNVVLNAWRHASGDLGAHKPEAYVAIDLDDTAMLHTAAYLFAGVYVCANLPGQSQEAARRGQDDLELRARRGLGAGLVGRPRVRRGGLLRERRLGHLLVGHGASASTRRWMQEYVYLTFAILSTDELQRVNGKNPQGIDLATLRADLAQALSARQAGHSHSSAAFASASLPQRL